MEKEIVIKNKFGLHARTALKLIEKIKDSPCQITIQKDNKQANAKSMLSIISLGASQGSKVKITVNGRDAEETMAKVIDIINHLEDDE